MLLGCKVLIFDYDLNLLMLKRTADAPYDPGVYCLPGGHVDTGETPEQAAVRECEEELDFKPILQLRKIVTIPANTCSGKPHPEFEVYVYESLELVPHSAIKVADEHDSGDWFSLDNLPAMNEFTKLLLA